MFLESLVEMEGLWFLPWAPSQPFQVSDTDTWIQKPGSFIGGMGKGRVHMHFWVWALHASVSRDDDLSLLPKALRGSQTPEQGAQLLPSSGTQPLVPPGAPGVSAKP